MVASYPIACAIPAARMDSLVTLTFAEPAWLLLLLLLPAEIILVVAARLQGAKPNTLLTWIAAIGVVAVTAALARPRLGLPDGYELRNQWALVLLLLIPLVWLTWRASMTDMGPIRRWFVLGVRVALVLLLVIAVAEPNTVEESDALCVTFIVDVSASMPDQLASDWYRQYIQAKLDEYAVDENDWRAVILFANNPIVQDLPAETKTLSPASPVTIDRSVTDIAAAIRQALATFPEGASRRIVLLTDGNNNRGDVIEEISYAKAQGVIVDVVPFEFERTRDIRLERIIVPDQVRKDEPFDIQIVLNSTHACEVTIVLSGTGLRGLPPEARSFRTKLAPGTNVKYYRPRIQVGESVASYTLNQPGFYDFHVEVIPDRDEEGRAIDDSLVQNNSGDAFTVVRGASRILFISGDTPAGAGPEAGEDRWIVNALSQPPFNRLVTFRTADELPTSLPQYQLFDCVVLSNVAASAFSEAKAQALERAVHDLGLGLIMLGGDRSYGAGGYRSTNPTVEPIVNALPLSPEVKEREVLLSGALVIILHTCEFTNANYWTKQLALAALNTLSDSDEFGVIMDGVGGQFGSAIGSVGWLIPLQKIGKNRPTWVTRISGASPGDMPDFQRAFQLAYPALKQSRGAVKHCIVISDGDPGYGSSDQALVADAAANKVSTTAISIIPHTTHEFSMVDIAQKGGPNDSDEDWTKRYWRIGEGDLNKLPQIFVHEAARVKTSLFKEGSIGVGRGPDAGEYIDGVGDVPNVRGVVVTTPKPNAQITLQTSEGEPVAAHWNHGTGRVVCVTTDARPRWAAPWLAASGRFPGLAALVSRMITWAQRQTIDDPYSQMRAYVHQGRGQIAIEAVDEFGNVRELPRLRVRVYPPTSEMGEPLQPEIVQLAMTAPGRYEGDFEAPRAGAYMIDARYVGGRDSDGNEIDAQLVTGLSVPYAQEYRDLRANLSMALRIAQETGGVIVTPIQEASGRYRADDSYQEYVIGRDFVGERDTPLGDRFAYNPFDRTSIPPAQKLAPAWAGLIVIALLLLMLDVALRKVHIDLDQVRSVVYPVLAQLPIVGPRIKEGEHGSHPMARLHAVKHRVEASMQAERERVAADRARREEEERMRIDSLKAAARDAALADRSHAARARSIGDVPQADGSFADQLKRAAQKAARRGDAGGLPDQPGTPDRGDAAKPKHPAAPESEQAPPPRRSSGGLMDRLKQAKDDALDDDQR